MQGNKDIANMVLLGTAAGYFLALPFQESFLGGLLTSGFGAAMVGGVADWFAVTALFRRPLGISFKTAVIPRSRGRISADIVDMLENRLLTKENIRSKLHDYDVTAMLLDFLEEGGKQDLSEAISAFIRDFSLRLRPQELANFLTELIKENTGSLLQFLANVITWSNQQGYTAKVFGFLLNESKKIVDSKQMYKLLCEFIEAARQTYAGERADRNLADWLFNQGGFTPERLAAIAQDKLQAFLSGLYQENNSLRLQFLEFMVTFPDRLLTDNRYQTQIESWKTELLANKELITAFARFIRQKASQNSDSMLVPLIALQLDRACQYITTDKTLYKKIDDYLTTALVLLVEKYHNRLGVLAANRLEGYTAEEISQLIEDKVSDDLQMIRLNGSTVGGLAGMLIFLLTYWWQ